MKKQKETLRMELRVLQGEKTGIIISIIVAMITSYIIILSIIVAIILGIIISIIVALGQFLYTVESV